MKKITISLSTIAVAGCIAGCAIIPNIQQPVEETPINNETEVAVEEVEKVEEVKEVEEIVVKSEIPLTEPQPKACSTMEKYGTNDLDEYVINYEYPEGTKNTLIDWKNKYKMYYYTIGVKPSDIEKYSFHKENAGSVEEIQKQIIEKFGYGSPIANMLYNDTSGVHYAYIHALRSAFEECR